MQYMKTNCFLPGVPINRRTAGCAFFAISELHGLRNYVIKGYLDT